MQRTPRPASARNRWRGRTYEDYLERRALKRLGKKRWRALWLTIVEGFNAALEVDYVGLGGGNVKKLGELPPGGRLGDNADGFGGGFRLRQES